MQYKWTRSPPEPRHTYKLKKKKEGKICPILFNNLPNPS